MNAQSRCRRRTRALLERRGPFAALAISTTVAACTTNPIRHVRSTYELTKTGSTEVQTETDLIEVGVQDRIGPDLEYRVSDKFVYGAQKLDTGSTSTYDESTLHRPSVDVVMTSGPVRWTQLFQSQEDRTLSGSGPDNTLVRNDFLEKLEWAPNDLPQVTAWLNYRTTEDEFFVDQERIETRLQVSQSIEPFDYDYSFRRENTDDLDADVESERTEHIARLTYQDRHLDDKLSTTVSVFASERDNSTDVPAGTIPSLQVFPTLAFADVDTTPQISSLSTNAALIDANFATSTGIDIGGFGSGGQISWNLAAQLPPGQSVDRIELSTVAVVPSNFANPFAFSVWASDDNTFWTLVKSSAAYVYDPAFQRFRLSIPSVNKRFVKVVNTSSPAGAPAVLISELEVFRSAGGSSTTTTKVDESVHSATTNVSWQVADTVSVGADVIAQQADADANGTTTRDEQRLDAGAWASWTPTEKFDANLRVADQRIDDPVLRDEEVVTLLGVLSYRPIRTLDFDLSFLRSDRDVDGVDDLRTDVAQALASAELLPTLRAEVSLEHNTTEDSTNQRDIERWIGGAALIAELTPTLDATVRARSDDASVTGSGSTGIPDPSEDRYELTLVYRPSEHLIGEAELRWIDSFAGSGLDQRLRVDWIPFGDGSLDLQFDFDRTSTQSFADTQTDRWRALARYGFNAYTFLEIQYAAEVPDQGDTTQVFTVSASFNN
ncbi:MAG: hypothetical protein IT453_14915 [Planctomycetes bacterium]|nr:hypothetical protein [Planctomycetota bacterium]